jgi:hypothetical protein
MTINQRRPDPAPAGSLVAQPLALVDAGQRIQRAIKSWDTFKGSAQATDLIPQTDLMNEYSALFVAADGDRPGQLIFSGERLGAREHEVVRHWLTAPMPPRPRTWSHSFGDSPDVRCAVLPFEEPGPRLLLVFAGD